jgi:predicted ester cyclase
VSDDRAIVERFEQAFAANDLQTVTEVCDPRLADHNPMRGLPPTLEGLKMATAGFHQAFPDLEYADGPHVIVEGDSAATRWILAGTHEGELLGIAPTGKRIRIEGMNFYRLANGRITEVWTQVDRLGLLQQLGALPAPNPEPLGT